jgi:hypothetical protein
MFPCKYPRVTGRRFLPGLVSIFLISLVLLAGCGGKDAGEKGGESVVLATVGDTDITAAMYEAGLMKMELADLPKDAEGKPMDMSTEEGKREFLQVLVNKELLRQKALQLGYDKDPQAVAAHNSLVAYHAGLAMWEDVVGDPANSISEEELQAFYKMMGVTRDCLFIICNFEDDALKAREFAMTGADWDEVISRFHDGDKAQSGKNEIKVPFGQYAHSFEDEVFATPVGGITKPILTSYGYWVMRVVQENQGTKPELEEAKARILDITRNRKIGRAREEFKEEVRKDHKLFIDESVLWICYQGIPEGGLMDPETNQPRAKEKLEPLNVPVADLGRLFYSYELNGELQEQTLGDYKGHFDNMSVFQRPKKGDMLGGLREHIIKELERGIVNEEAEKRGYYDDPEVLAQVNTKVEEVMVTKLYGDAVKFDERVTPEQVDTFYNEHTEDFYSPETRSGRMVVCLNEEEAVKARAQLDQGKPWRAILKEFDTDKENSARMGKLEGISAVSSGPVKDALFSLDMGQASEPFPIANGRYGVVVMDVIQPGRQKEKSEVIEVIGQRVKGERKEAAFQTLLSKWGTELGVTRFEENLAGLPTWEELHTKVTPENLVPRN